MLTRFAVRSPLRFLTSSLYLSSLGIPTRHRTMSTSTFKLDPTIFNPALYKQIADVWFTGVDRNGQELDMTVVKRWFAGTPSERATFDTQCRTAFSHALEAIGPQSLPSADARPFIEEIARIASLDNPDSPRASDQAAWTALSLTLLLDQMPRNIYRTDDGLRLVYSHYDRLSYALSRILLSPSSPINRSDTHPLFRHAAAYRLWFYMPLMHSEDLSAHRLIDEILAKYGEELEGLEGYNGSKMFHANQAKAEKEHVEILEKFGRYPHRNAALGRESTEEEVRFLGEGGATFGVGQGEEKK